MLGEEQQVRSPTADNRLLIVMIYLILNNYTYLLKEKHELNDQRWKTVDTSDKIAKTH